MSPPKIQCGSLSPPRIQVDQLSPPNSKASKMNTLGSAIAMIAKMRRPSIMKPTIVPSLSFFPNPNIKAQ
jgi:hypothetical protein